jgi:preprotein translocase subunit SecG
MNNVLLAVNIIVSILIVVFILVQGRGGGLGSAWGGGGETYHTRRGVEKVTLRVTVFLIVIFFIIAVVNLLIR